MDCQKYLFMVWNKKDGIFVDKTSEIKRYQYSNGYYKIWLRSGSVPKH